MARRERYIPAPDGYPQSRAAQRQLYGARSIDARAPQSERNMSPMTNSAWADTFKVRTGPNTFQSTATADTQTKALQDRLEAGDKNPTRNLSANVLDRISEPASPLNGMWGNVATMAPDKLTAALLGQPLDAPQFSFMPQAQPSAAPSISTMASNGGNSAQRWQSGAGSFAQFNGLAGTERLLRSPYGIGGSFNARGGMSSTGAHSLGDETGDRTRRFSQSQFTGSGLVNRTPPRPRQSLNLLAGTRWGGY